VSETLGILGAGAFGTALADVLGAAGRRVVVNADPARVCGEARLVVLAVSSRRARELVPELGKHVDGRHMVVHALGALLAPGGDAAAELRVSELLRRETAVRRIGVIAGPALARDLLERTPAALLVASPHREVVTLTQTLLSSPPALRVYGSPDLVGAELAAAIAGALTVGMGMADALGFGPGPRALLVTRAVAEAARLVVAAGGRERTMSGLAGLGNLLVRSSSASSERSDDYQLGLVVGRGETPARESEGARTLPALVRLARTLGVRVPILAGLEGALHERRPIAGAVEALLESHALEE
jgi:glycerol-3-phosphate dehydrogenase (NAD(P)+)